MTRTVSSNPLSRQGGFTFIEVIISCMMLLLLVAAVAQYHASSGASSDQKYYLKAVQVARAELEKLKALFELVHGQSAKEFTAQINPAPDDRATPDDIFLFRFEDDGTSIELPYENQAAPDDDDLFRVYYQNHDDTRFLRALGDSPPYGVNSKNTAVEYHDYYVEAYDAFDLSAEGLEADDVDKRLYTYFADDNNDTTNASAGAGKIDASVVVIDDMGSPEDPEDDLLGYIGWWVKNIDTPKKNKKVTFVLQFWYPGQNKTIPPECIVIKTTLVQP